MTSKTSCNNSTSYKNRIPYRRYILENIKQRSWLAATSLIAFFSSAAGLYHGKY